MKIAILTPTLHPFSGIDRVAQMQGERFAREGHQVTIIALETSLKPKGCEVVALGMPKNVFWQRLYRLFFFMDRKALNSYRMLKEHDKVIAHFYPMTWLAYEAKKYYRTRYIYWDHGINTTGLLDSIPQKIYMFLFRLLNNYTIRTADEVYSVSKYLSGQLWKESGIKSKVIYNTIDSSRFKKNAKAKGVREKYHLEDKKIVLYVGRIAPHKGVHYLLEAMQKVQQVVPKTALVIVGKETFPGYAQKLRDLAKKLRIRNVVFAGFVEDKDLPNHYAACNVYASASQWEGYNLPAAEAQACGKPVVAFNLGSHPEIIKKGILVENRDIGSFANAIVRVLKGKKNQNEKK